MEMKYNKSGLSLMLGLLVICSVHSKLKLSLRMKPQYTHTITDQERENGFILTLGWKKLQTMARANKEKFPEKGWEIKDGILFCTILGWS